MDTLNQSLNALYTIFSSYTINENFRDRACQCCVTNKEIQSLLSKPLKQLSGDDIEHFSRSAITTYGDVEDYKHFLPRILELIQLPNSNVLDDFTTFEKLNYSSWLTWSEEEVLSIKNYFKSLLIDALNTNSHLIQDYISLNLEYNNFEELSELLLNTNSKLFLYGIIENVLSSYAYPFESKLHKLYSDERILNKIEALFFEEKDKTKANGISIAYTLLENQVCK